MAPLRALLLAGAAPLAAAQWGSLGGIDTVMCSGWTLRLDEMNRVCCAEEPNGECPNGFPSTCTTPCAAIFGDFNDDCEGMFSYLGLTSNPQYMQFAAMCEDNHEPSGLSSSMGGTAVVQFELDTDDVEGDLPEGAAIYICGSMNSWCTYNEGVDRSPQDAAPIVMTRGQGYADTRDWFAQVNLDPGTYAYKYQIVPDTAHPEDHTWEDVPEECGVAWDRGFDRVLTVTSSVTSQFSYGSGVTIFDIFSDCGDGPTDCELNLTHEPALDATFLGEADERTGDHEMTLAGDAHIEADGVHFDGDGDYVSFPSFDYYDAKPGKQVGDFGSDSPSFTISMWASTDVCDPADPTPSVFGYVFSHNQDSDSHPLAADNSNINIYQGCANGGYMRFVFVGASGFASYDVPFQMLIEGGSLEDVTFAQFGFTFSGNSITMYVNGLQLMYDFQLAAGPASVAMGAVSGPAWQNSAVRNGQVNLMNLNNGVGIGRFNLAGDIFVGGRGDLDADRFYTGAISGLQIFTDGASAADFQCIYNHQELAVLGTTAHTCTFHSEGYRWRDPTTDPRAERLSEVCGKDGQCNFASGAVGNLQGDSPDDGYFYMDLAPLGISFPFMGRAEHELYISANGYISFAGPQTGDSGQASNPETTVIPSAGAKPDDAIFAYWTDLDFSKGGEIYISTNAEEQTSTITWLDAPYYCHGAGEGEWSSEPDYGPAWHTGTNCIGKTASFQVILFADGRIKIQYKSVDPYAAPAWAPVSIGLESWDGFDGIQVAYDDHDWPRSGTAIGFAATCAIAGENDCGPDDLARATVACTTFNIERPDCVPGAYGIPVSDSCGPAFCGHECFNEMYNFHEDCLNNPRSTLSAEDQQTFSQLMPPSLVASCPAPDSGTSLPPGGGH